jgi:dTDP-4-dehydrorhamnose reductase
MKILVFGAKGQLGRSLMTYLRPSFISSLGFDRTICDLGHQSEVEVIIAKEKPDLIINCAAYTNVEKAEEDIEKANLINREACGKLAESCQKENITLIHISTDYVFDGKEQLPYCETDKVNPLNQYGESKLAGEFEIQNRCEKYIILRVSSLFSKEGNNFVNTMLTLFESKKSIRVVDDQFHCPTSTRSVAQAIFTICERLHLDSQFKGWGIYHFCNSPPTSWYEFAKTIKDFSLPNAKFIIHDILPIPASEYKTKAMRPAYSVLNCEKIQRNFGIQQTDWRDELQKLFN